jgi:hypothetical protein
MDGHKAVEISQYPLLNLYHQQFRDYLARAARLMIIGYSFSDAHKSSDYRGSEERGYSNIHH